MVSRIVVGRALFLPLFFVISLACNAAKVAAEEPYATLINESTVTERLLVSVRGAKANLPKKSEVPVQAYPDAVVFAVTPLSSTNKDTYQDNLIVSLASKDKKGAVVNFYKKALSEWKHEALSNGTDVFVESGAQTVWRGETLLEAPRLEVSDLSSVQENTPVGFYSKELRETNPDIRTVLRVFFEMRRTPLLAINLPDLLERCIEKETKNAKARASADASVSDQAAANEAERRCKESVEKWCVEDAKGRFCQKYAQIYGK